MLSNAYFLAKFRCDIAENEPAKKVAKFCKIISTNFANHNSAETAVLAGRGRLGLRGADGDEARGPRGRGARRAGLRDRRVRRAAARPRHRGAVRLRTRMNNNE